LVKIAAAKCTASARCSSSACDETSVQHLAKRPLQVDRLGSRSLHIALVAADHALDGAEQTGLQSGRFEQLADQERGGGLAVGAGHAGDLQRRGRVGVERRGGGRHRLAHRWHEDLRHAEAQPALDDERDRAAPDRVGSVVMAVAREPRDTEKQGARFCGPVVVGEVSDLDVPRRGRGTGNHLVQPHRASSLAWDPAAPNAVSNQLMRNAADRSAACRSVAPGLEPRAPALAASSASASSSHPWNRRSTPDAIDSQPRIGTPSRSTSRINRTRPRSTAATIARLRRFRPRHAP
jgi:hypothetical protein